MTEKYYVARKRAKLNQEQACEQFARNSDLNKQLFHMPNCRNFDGKLFQVSQVKMRNDQIMLRFRASKSPVKNTPFFVFELEGTLS